MADEFQSGGNWWEASRNRYETGISPSSSSLSSLGTFAWPADMADVKTRSIESASTSPNSAMIFGQEAQKLQDPDATAGGGDPNLHIMGLGLSSQAMDWNQALFRGGEKATETSFRSMLQDNMNLNSSYQHETGQQQQQQQQQQFQWMRSPSEKLFSGDSSASEFKPMNRGFSLDHPPQFSPQYSSGDSAVTCQGLATSFQVDTAANLYGNSATLLQGLLGGDQSHQQQSSTAMNFPYSAHFPMNSMELMPSWSAGKVPQFLRNSPPKAPTPPSNSHLQFSNNTPFWNASDAAMKDVRPSFFPGMQTQYNSPAFAEKSKNISEARDSATTVVKKSGNDQSAAKRPRNETPSPLPAFKVRKEKMGDRITALQQLVSPFGKTDTASVLSEAIEYIKFLHEQVSVLSTPYMKSGAAMQQQNQQRSEKSKDHEGPKQDLRSRGLCLVPVSSTFPVTHETTVDFWTPTFGGTFR